LVAGLARGPFLLQIAPNGENGKGIAEGQFTVASDDAPGKSAIRELYDIRSTGAAIAETAYYPALANLLNEVDNLPDPFQINPRIILYHHVKKPAPTGAGFVVH
jgi:hypothetical protein